jgi:hypothetical protein
MKKIIIIPFLFAFATASFCQQVTTKKQSFTQEDYLKKSKNKKKIGWILLGGGAVLAATAAIIPKGEYEGREPCLYGFACESYKNDDIIGGLAVSATLSMLGSIPFFLSSGKNKRRANAISASFKTEDASISRGYNLVRIKYPALSLKLDLH